jgi:hypothetical protein
VETATGNLVGEAVVVREIVLGARDSSSGGTQKQKAVDAPAVLSSSPVACDRLVLYGLWDWAGQPAAARTPRRPSHAAVQVCKRFASNTQYSRHLSLVATAGYDASSASTAPRIGTAIVSERLVQPTTTSVGLVFCGRPSRISACRRGP